MPITRRAVLKSARCRRGPAIGGCRRAPDADQPVRIAGQPVEIAVTPIDARIIRVSVVPAGDNGLRSIPDDGSLVRQDWGRADSSGGRVWPLRRRSRMAIGGSRSRPTR